MSYQQETVGSDFFSGAPCTLRLSGGLRSPSASTGWAKLNDTKLNDATFYFCF